MAKPCAFPGCVKPQRLHGLCPGHHSQLRKGKQLTPLKYHHLPLAERFARYLSPGAPEDCWEWRGQFNACGYGKFRLTPNSMNLAHRVAWQIAHGPIPDGLHVCHHCDNPPCCNPAHLFLGTHGDNMRDREIKGRGSIEKAQRARWPRPALEPIP